MPNRLNRNSDFPVAIAMKAENDATGDVELVSGLSDVLIGLSLDPTLPSIVGLELSAGERVSAPGQYFCVFAQAALQLALADDALLGERIFVMLIKPGDLKNELLDELEISDWDDA